MVDVLRKRDGYRNAFADFDVEVVARFGRKDVESLLADPAIVRNRLKIESTVGNAARVLEVRASVSFAAYLWSFVGDEPIVGRWTSVADVPAETDLSRELSRTSSAAASASSARRSATRSCSRPAWSTTTPSTASASERLRLRRDGQACPRGSRAGCSPDSRHAVSSVLDSALARQSCCAVASSSWIRSALRGPAVHASRTRSPRARARRSRPADGATASAPPSRCTGGYARTSGLDERRRPLRATGAPAGGRPRRSRGGPGEHGPELTVVEAGELRGPDRREQRVRLPP